MPNTIGTTLRSLMTVKQEKAVEAFIGDRRPSKVAVCGSGLAWVEFSSVRSYFSIDGTALDLASALAIKSAYKPKRPGRPRKKRG